MKMNRKVLLVAAFLALGSGLMLSRVWSGGRTSPTTPEREVAAASRGEMSKPEREQETVIAAAAGQVVLDADQARVSLRASGPGESLSAKLKSLATNRRIYLVIGDMSAAEQPGVPYNIFFDLPADAKADLNSPHYVDTITFFNAVRLEGADPNSKDPRFFSFDVTEIVRNLESKRLLSEDTAVTIKAAGVPASDAKPRIGRVELVTH